MGTEITKNNFPEEISEERNTTLFNSENPVAIINLVSPSIRQRIEDAYAKLPELFSLDEIELGKCLRAEHSYNPSAVDNRLRLKFWFEYDRVVLYQGTKKMIAANFLAGVCTDDFFYNSYLKNTVRVSWLLCPPTSYITKAKEGLDYGLDQIREILQMPIEVNGRRDLRLAALKITIVKMLDDRVQGSVVQRVEQKTTQVNVNTTAGEINQIAREMSMEEIERKIAALQVTDRPNSFYKKAINDANKPKETHDQSKAEAIEVEVKHVSTDK